MLFLVVLSRQSRKPGKDIAYTWRMHYAHAAVVTQSRVLETPLYNVQLNAHCRAL